MKSFEDDSEEIPLVVSEFEEIAKVVEEEEVEESSATEDEEVDKSFVGVILDVIGGMFGGRGR